MRRRFGRWAVLGVVLFAGLLVTFDVVALQVFQSRGAAQIAQAMAAERASLDVGGLPMLPDYVRGRLRRVEAEVIGSSAGGLRIESLRIRFEDARFPPGKVFSLLRSRFSTRAEITGESVVGRIDIVERDLEELLKVREPRILDVGIDPSGVEIVFGDEDQGTLDEESQEEPSGPTARYLPRVEGQRLVLRLLGAAGLPRDLREDARAIEDMIDLPQVPEGLRTSIQLGNGVFQVEASGPSITLSVGEGGDEEEGS